MAKSNLLALIPALPLLGAAIILLIGRHMSRRFVHAVAVGSVIAAFLVALHAICGASVLAALGLGPEDGAPAADLWSLYRSWREATPRAEAMGGLVQIVWTWIE